MLPQSGDGQHGGRTPLAIHEQRLADEVSWAGPCDALAIDSHFDSHAPRHHLGVGQYLMQLQYRTEGLWARRAR